MTHFAAVDYGETINLGPRACVAVKANPSKGHLEIQKDSFRVSAPGVWIRVNPKLWPVVDAAGEVIPAGRGNGYYVSAHTFDPFHLLTVIFRT